MLGSRWQRKDYKPEMGEYVGYTVIAVTNTEHVHPNHPQQVVYEGDNGFIWSRALVDWPGSLVPETYEDDLCFDGSSIVDIADNMINKQGFVVTIENMEIDMTNFTGALVDALESLYKVESDVYKNLNRNTL